MSQDLHLLSMTQISGGKTGRELRHRQEMQVLAHGSLNDFWHEVQTAFDGVGILLHVIPIIGLGHHVGAKPLRFVKRVRHRQHIVGIGLAQLIDEIDDSRQLVDGFGHVGIGEFESRQHSDVLNLIFIE
jgi:hypothetical protein